MLKKFIAIFCAIFIGFTSMVTPVSAYSISYNQAFVPDAVNSMVTWGAPVKSNSNFLFARVNSKWNEVRNVSRGSSPHIGVDLNVGVGYELCAVDDGYLTKLNDANNTASLYVSATHPSLYSNLNVYCHYEHCSYIQDIPFVSKGDSVGRSGNYGPNTIGAHLHFAAENANAINGRKSYRTEPFYRLSNYDSFGNTWNQGKRLDTFYDVNWINDCIAQVSFSISGINNDDSEIPSEVIFYYKKLNDNYWVYCGNMTQGANPNVFSFDTTQLSESIPSGTLIRWMVRYKRDGIDGYMWAPAKYYNPDSNPNSPNYSAYTYAHYLNRVIY